MYTVKISVMVSFHEYKANMPWLTIAKTTRKVLNDFGSDDDNNNNTNGAKVWRQQKLIV